MIKSFLIFISFSTLLFGSQQIILVVADDFNSSTASLSCFEGKKRYYHHIKVNLGHNGLGWGIGKEQIPHKSDEPIKHEGDKKAPAGVFTLSTLFGTIKNQAFSMFYLLATPDLLCIDDSTSKYYNTLQSHPFGAKSFEHMRRKDHLYDLGIRVNHNDIAKKGAGSCIFLHIQRGDNMPTAGCTSMKASDLYKLAHWLDKEKNPLLIQITKEYLPYIKSKYLH